MVKIKEGSKGDMKKDKKFGGKEKKKEWKEYKKMWKGKKC